jgi:hypothetical protein
LFVLLRIVLVICVILFFPMNFSIDFSFTLKNHIGYWWWLHSSCNLLFISFSRVLQFLGSIFLEDLFLPFYRTVSQCCLCQCDAFLVGKKWWGLTF